MVDGQLARGDQGFEIVAERLDVCGEISGALLEAHEDSGLAEASGAVHQKSDAEHGLPGSRRAADESRVSRPAARLG
jgi:hypothetical protein